VIININLIKTAGVCKLLRFRFFLYHPAVFVDVCQSEHNSQHITHSSAIYNMFRPSFGQQQGDFKIACMGDLHLGIIFNVCCVFTW